MIREMIPVCGQRGIPYLTLFAFSSENWRRPGVEVKFLIELLTQSLEEQVCLLHDNQVRLRVIGDINRFPGRLQRAAAAAAELTCNNEALNLTVAINYGGQWDLQQAFQSISGLVEKGELSADSITPQLIESRLCTSGLPAPDLFIRTGGERRISNFLLWQLAYTELYFTDTFWPDFDEESFNQALCWFASRQRRFGRVGSQVEAGVFAEQPRAFNEA